MRQLLMLPGSRRVVRAGGADPQDTPMSRTPSLLATKAPRVGGDTRVPVPALTVVLRAVCPPVGGQ